MVKIYHAIELHELPYCGRLREIPDGLDVVGCWDNIVCGDPMSQKFEGWLGKNTLGIQHKSVRLEPVEESG